MNVKKNLVTGAVTVGASMFLLASSAFADVNISGNGSYSDNTVVLHSSSTDIVSQKSDTDVANIVYSSADSGGNSSKYNTGGSNSITTGDASSTVGISVIGGSNVASLPNPCGCPGNEHNVTISGNGSSSDSDVYLFHKDFNLLKQKLELEVYNKVKSDVDSGHNYAWSNTGEDADIHTGEANSQVYISVTGGSNEAL